MPVVITSLLDLADDMGIERDEPSTTLKHRWHIPLHSTMLLPFNK